MPILSTDPDDVARELISHFKQTYSEVEELILRLVPNNRDRSIALTELENSSMRVTRALCHSRDK